MLFNWFNITRHFSLWWKLLSSMKMRYYDPILAKYYSKAWDPLSQRTPHLVLFQPPPSVPHWQSTFSSSLPFDILLQKIPGPRFLSVLGAGENYVQVILWQFPGRTRDVEALRAWRFVSEILHYHFIIVIVISLWFFIRQCDSSYQHCKNTNLIFIS